MNGTVTYQAAPKALAVKHLPKHILAKHFDDKQCERCGTEVVVNRDSFTRASRAALIGGMKLMMLCGDCVKKQTSSGQVHITAQLGSQPFESEVDRWRAEQN